MGILTDIVQSLIHDKLWMPWCAASFTCVIFLIFGIYTDTNIPYVNWWICLLFWSGVILSLTRMKLIPCRQRLVACISLLIVSMLSWTLLSYTSYYNGTTSGAVREVKRIHSSVKGILGCNLSDLEKQQLIHNIFNKNVMEGRVHFIIKKNGDPYYENDFNSKASENYMKEDIAEKSHVGDIRIDQDVYQFIFDYYNKPYPLVGISRALLFSTNERINDHEYIKRKNYQRSINFALPFIFLYSFTLLALYLYQKLKKEKAAVEDSNAKIKAQKIELERVNQSLMESRSEIAIQKDKLEKKKNELEKANMELKSKEKENEVQKRKLEKKNIELEETNNNLRVFEHTFSKIQRDYERIINDSKGNLQHISSTWDSIGKKVAGSNRHDVMNRIANLKHVDIRDIEKDYPAYEENVKAIMEILKAEENCYNEACASGQDEKKVDLIGSVYNVLVAPWLNKIRNELKGLDRTLSIAPERIAVKEILDRMEPPRAIPKTIAENKIKWKVFEKTVEEGIDTSAICEIVPDKLESIVFNLIENSSKAIGDYDKKMKLRSYVGRICLTISEKERDGRKCLAIEVKDNGGGFGDNIIDKVYKEPIRTTKNAREFGEGTVYIGYFARLMKSAIEAKNVIYENGEKGASTTLFIPYEKQ